MYAIQDIDTALSIKLDTTQVMAVVNTSTGFTAPILWSQLLQDTGFPYGCNFVVTTVTVQFTHTSYYGGSASSNLTGASVRIGCDFSRSVRFAVPRVQ